MVEFMEKEDEVRPRGKDEVCRALVVAATKLVARQGSAGTTTREIAAEARVNQGLITRYFGTKQALMREVARQVATQMFDQVLHSSLQLEDLLVTGVAGQEETLRALIQILFDPELAWEGFPLAELQGRFADWLKSQIGFPAKGDQMEARVFLVASVMLGSQLVTSSTRAFPELKRDVLDLFMNGFRKG